MIKNKDNNIYDTSFIRLDYVFNSGTQEDRLLYYYLYQLFDDDSRNLLIKLKDEYLKMVNEKIDLLRCKVQLLQEKMDLSTYDLFADNFRYENHNFLLFDKKAKVICIGLGVSAPIKRKPSEFLGSLMEQIKLFEESNESGLYSYVISDIKDFIKFSLKNVDQLKQVLKELDQYLSIAYQIDEINSRIKMLSQGKIDLEIMDDIFSKFINDGIITQDMIDHLNDNLYRSINYCCVMRNVIVEDEILKNILGWYLEVEYEKVRRQDDSLNKYIKK